MDVKTAARTLDLFEAFAALRRPVSLSELAGKLGMPLSSCFALVKTVERRGYLYSTRSRGPIYPTGRLLVAARAITGHDPVAQRVGNELARLRDRTGETVVIGVLTGREVGYVDVFESTQAIRYSPPPGARRPAHANSIAKAILGELPTGERAHLLAALEYKKLTSRTVRTAAQLEAEVQRSRRRGWSANVGESAPDLAAVAMAVRINGDLFGISIAGPLHRIEPRLRALASQLRGVAARITDKPLQRASAPK
jgi:DNA-binding IclR family transcriptional regulator